MEDELQKLGMMMIKAEGMFDDFRDYFIEVKKAFKKCDKVADERKDFDKELMELIDEVHHKFQGE